MSADRLWIGPDSLLVDVSTFENAKDFPWFCKSHPIYANPIHGMELPEGVVCIGHGEYAPIFEYRWPDKDLS